MSSPTVIVIRRSFTRSLRGQTNGVRDGLPERVARRLNPDERYGLRLTLLAVALVLTAIPFGLLLQQVLVDGPVVRADAAAAEWIHDAVVDVPALVTFMRVVSFLGKPIWLYIVVGAAVLWLAVRSQWRLAAFLVATPLLGGLVDTVIKVAVDRDRPDFDEPIAHAMGKSFPSGHSMSSVVAYGALAVVFVPVVARRLRPPLLGAVAALCFLIGVSRLALGVHFLSDVLGGWILGVAWLAAGTAAFEVWRVERGRRRTDPLEEGIEPEALHDLTGA